MSDTNENQEDVAATPVRSFALTDALYDHYKILRNVQPSNSLVHAEKLARNLQSFESYEETNKREQPDYSCTDHQTPVFLFGPYTDKIKQESISKTVKVHRANIKILTAAMQPFLGGHEDILGKF